MFIIKKIKTLELWGCIFTIILGTLFHFAYEAINQWRPLAFFFPINESVWEHLKMSFWPFIFFGIIEAFILKSRISNIIVSKTFGIYTSIVLIVGVHYLYRSIVGHPVVVADIILFITSIIIGYLVSYRVLIKKHLSTSLKLLSYFLILMLAFMIIYFTYYPPDFFLFISGS
ncbi:hypothetical protein F8153_04870 [Alkaliphilus serpentinus]|uniref:Uncharacterized protein n=1 Tax=Alkaliphilus serpentinus TaxID=1482731 RepID=A0A833HQ78_9FIRM|nr:hypothetical protein F8153_04870 [Alkaliphilus serpentinus]